MPQHRETSSSISVRDLLGDGIAGRSTRHRAEPRTGDRVKLAATAAVATGALVGTAAQLAQAAPLLPMPGGHASNSADTIELKSAAGPDETVKQAAPAARVPLKRPPPHRLPRRPIRPRSACGIFRPTWRTRWPTRSR